jgi:hypothetical protein
LPVETATYVSDLNASNPAHSDPLSAADAHMRLIKAALKATFPNINAAVTPTPAALNQIGTVGSVGAPSVNFGGTTEGFYKKAAGQVGITGTLRGAGAMPVGAVVHFVAQPVNMGSVALGLGSGKEWLELDGGTYNQADYPELASYFGVASGTFTLPNVRDTGRFLRSRTSVTAALTIQGNAFSPHTHTATADNQGNHTHTGTTQGESANHQHTYITATNYTDTAVVSNGVPSSRFWSGSQTVLSSAETVAHSHTFTSDVAGLHSHNITVGSTGLAAENRPECMSVVVCVKT